MNDVNINSSNPVPASSVRQIPGAPALSPSTSGSTPSRSTSVAANDSLQKADVAPNAQQKVAERQTTEERGQVVKAVTQLNDYVQSLQRNLEFELDESSGQSIIKVIDRSTHEVIRQIPDELAIKLAQKLQQEEPLSLFNVKV